MTPIEKIKACHNQGVLSELTLAEHQALCETAVYVEEDSSYFVLELDNEDRQGAFYGVICESYTSGSTTLPLGLGLLIVHRTHTAARAQRLVHDQYRIDAFDES